MTPVTNDALVQRIERLEAENRRLRWVGLAIAFAACALSAGGAALQEPTTIETEKLAIVVQGGATRASIATTSEGYPTISLRNEHGQSGLFALQGSDQSVSVALYDDSTDRLWLALSPNGTPYLKMYDGKDRERLHLGIDGNESSRLDLTDGGDNSRASLVLPPDQDPMLAFCDKEGTLRLAVDSAVEKRPGIMLFDNRKDMMRGFFGLGQDDLAALAIRGSESRDVAELWCERNGDGFFRVYDGHEKTLFVAPDH